jgi:hypothetical protein
MARLRHSQPQGGTAAVQLLQLLGRKIPCPWLQQQELLVLRHLLLLAGPSQWLS